jgi:hypothetical protein
MRVGCDDKYQRVLSRARGSPHIPMKSLISRFSLPAGLIHTPSAVFPTFVWRGQLLAAEIDQFTCPPGRGLSTCHCPFEWIEIGIIIRIATSRHTYDPRLSWADRAMFAVQTGLLARYLVIVDARERRLDRAP